MIGKYNVDINRITMVTPKGFYTVGGNYYNHDDSSIFDIMFRCKDIIRSCNVVLPELRYFTDTAHSLISDRSTGDFVAYCEGVDSVYRYILNIRDHAEKILKQAERAERYTQ